MSRHGWSVAVFHHYSFQQPGSVPITSSTFPGPQIYMQIVRLIFFLLLSIFFITFILVDFMMFQTPVKDSKYCFYINWDRFRILSIHFSDSAGSFQPSHLGIIRFIKITSKYPGSEFSKISTASRPFHAFVTIIFSSYSRNSAISIFSSLSSTSRT